MSRSSFHCLRWWKIYNPASTPFSTSTAWINMEAIKGRQQVWLFIMKDSLLWKNNDTLTIIRLRLPVMLSVGEREGWVGAAGEAGALLWLQATNPHVLQAMIRGRVHLRLCVHVRSYAQRIATAVHVGGCPGAEWFILLLLMLLLLLLVQVEVWAPHLARLTKV